MKSSSRNSPLRLFIIIANANGKHSIGTEIKSWNGIFLNSFVYRSFTRLSCWGQPRTFRALLDSASDKNIFELITLSHVSSRLPRPFRVSSHFRSWAKRFPLMSCNASCFTRSRLFAVFMISSNCEIFLLASFQCHSQHFSSFFSLNASWIGFQDDDDDDDVVWLNFMIYLNWIIASSTTMIVDCATGMKWDKWMEIVHQIVAWSWTLLLGMDRSDVAHLTWKSWER